MIKKFKVNSLKGIGSYSLDFNPDLNIITGKNGSGKTTLLKLLWYMLSPNLERIVPEINFDEAELITDQFTVKIQKEKEENKEKVTFSFEEKGKEVITVRTNTDSYKDPFRLDKIEKLNQRILALKTSSVFFPTFRRIEGGFSIEPHRRFYPSYRISSSLSESMEDYSQMMTVKTHKFVASISTSDIEDLITKKYADISDQTNKLHTELSNFISNEIKQKSPSTSSHNDAKDSVELQTAKELISSIKREVDKVENIRSSLLKPFDVLSELVAKIFKDKGIRINSNLTFGETKEAIQANILSAGEKQMLSFLCYNAFNSYSPIFIDEPELSLHVDWQRILFAILKEQGTKNQFIVSTHSPFIYSKYPEKELVLNIDKGNN